jgi:hypothetical protein
MKKIKKNLKEGELLKVTIRPWYVRPLVALPHPVEGK